MLPISSRLNPSRISRRPLLGAIVVSALLGTVPAQAQSTPKPDKIAMDDLMAANALSDVVQGGADAKVTIIEYASMTCTHCARFHQEVYPALKAKYIDTNKIKFILREFPLDPLATAGFMLARCSGSDEKRTALVDIMFSQQKSWAFVDKPIEALLNLTKQAGFTQEAFETCLKDQSLYDNINKIRNRASEKFGIDATPTFYINGVRRSGELSIDDLDKAITPLLAP
jgi:protein-disulfide isomerase